MNAQSFSIVGREIGTSFPCYIIAEISANHGQKLEQALKIIEAAKEAGADAVKLQTYTPDTITLNCRTAPFMIGKGTLWEGRNLYDLYGEAYTPWEWHPALMDHARKLALHCFSSPFDFTAVDFLEGLHVPAYKIASFELIDLPLIRKVARTGRPVIMSTGMASLAEIQEAVLAFRGAGGAHLALLKCTSAYPSPAHEMNLRTIGHLQSTFHVPTGLSDHTLGIEVPIAARAVGACIIEKHLTLSRSEPGPDSAFSLEPHEFKQMVRAVRIAEEALGTISYTATDKESASRIFRRSLFVTSPMKAGDVLTAENVRSVRPSHGLHTRYWESVIGRKVTRSIEKGTPLNWDLVEGGEPRLP
jgi:pseudaminic acid synthase